MRERWIFELVDPLGSLIGPLEDVTTAQISGNVNRQIRWDGSITLGRESGIDWTRVRVRVSYQKNDETPIRFGVFVPVLDQSDHTEGEHGQATEKISLFDRTNIPASDAVADTYTVLAGTRVTSAVRALLESTGEAGVSITEQGDTTRTDLVWDPGTTKLRIINDLLDSVGFFALHTSYGGQYVLEPYTAPRMRPVVASYMPGGRDLYTPKVSTTYPDLPVNRVILRARGDGDVPDLVATAENKADFQRTGVWRTKFSGDVEATSQTVLQSMAARQLEEAGKATWTRSRTIAVAPLELNDVIAGADGGRETVEELSVTCTPGSLMTLETREVYGG